MELILILVVVVVAAFLLYKHFTPKTQSTTVTVADVVAKAEVVEANTQVKPAVKKAPVKKAPAKKPVAAKKPRAK